MLHEEITNKIIQAFYKVYNHFGFGFLESVYENALFIELQNTGLIVEKQKSISVYYNNIVVGDYQADLIIENKIIVEIKAISKIVPINEVQIVNYLKATKLEVGLLLNFGNKPEIKRKILNQNKSPQSY